jgi:hypothetical protein
MAIFIVAEDAALPSEDVMQAPRSDGVAADDESETATNHSKTMKPKAIVVQFVKANKGGCGVKRKPRAKREFLNLLT